MDVPLLRSTLRAPDGVLKRTIRFRRTLCSGSNPRNFT
jgi:hypothetical protein